MNIVDILNKVSISNVRKKADILEQYEIEYILKYCEINKNRIKKKYKILFDKEYHIKINLTFYILYDYFLNTYDKRILNTLLKNYDELKNSKSKYHNEYISKLIYEKILLNE